MFLQEISQKLPFHTHNYYRTNWNISNGCRDTSACRTRKDRSIQSIISPTIWNIGKKEIRYLNLALKVVTFGDKFWRLRLFDQFFVNINFTPYFHLLFLPTTRKEIIHIQLMHSGMWKCTHRGRQKQIFILLFETSVT